MSDASSETEWSERLETSVSDLNASAVRDSQMFVHAEVRERYLKGIGDLFVPASSTEGAKETQ
ncbi:hypothetical protein MVES1_001973 [Malassezia vespertilionis]|uniref:Uncharacterized protein n=1 Tax=Malassezia vespertilionis TaxID=2020962 RepID=A0A2N1JBP2_9BASI|nr:uncharacterized protein MVES1_001973 [Malassezia vespertilionis]PKI83967.1 hypothetical protein MVES_001869 [Malassezia vespertilionis]WFD06619.1 hypothetical protein MVES1_001973 [Malassezia vespertilionis]